MVIKNAASLKAMCVASYPRWSGVSPSDLGISVVGGGLSNLNYRVALADGVALPEEGPREVLLRLFGGGSHELIDREQENACMALAGEHGVGAKVLGRFEGGRVEQFISNARTWDCADMVQLPRAAALARGRSLAHLHAIPLASMPQSQTLLPAEHTYDAPSAATAAAASATAFPVVPEAAPVAVLPGRLRAWAAAAVRAEADILARASSSQDPSQDPGRSNAQRAKHVRAGRQVHALSLGDVAAVEVPWLVGHLAALASPLVFSHNDINAGNVMEQMAADTSAVGNIMLVDFEFAGVNWRGFDLANAVCEAAINNQCPHHPGFVLNPAPLHDEALKAALATAYLDEAALRAAVLGGGPGGAAGGVEHAAAEGSAGGSVGGAGEGSVGESAEVTALVREMDAFILASHMQWALWGVVQEASSELTWGFLDYSHQRLSQYFALKGELGLA